MVQGLPRRKVLQQSVPETPLEGGAQGGVQRQAGAAVSRARVGSRMVQRRL